MRGARIPRAPGLYRGLTRGLIRWLTRWLIPAVLSHPPRTPIRGLCAGVARRSVREVPGRARDGFGAGGGPGCVSGPEFAAVARREVPGQARDGFGSAAASGAMRGTRAGAGTGARHG